MPKVDLTFFCRSLEVMLQAGIPIHHALQVLERGARDEEAQIYAELLRNIEHGRGVAESMEKSAYHFPPLMVSCMAIAESSGQMHRVFGKMTGLLERKDRLRGKMIAALIYPAILLLMTVLVSLGVVFFVLPREKELLSGMGVEMPALTLALVKIVETLSHPGVVLVAITSLAGGSLFLRRTISRNLRDELEHWMFQWPFVGPLIRDLNAVIFLHGCALLLGSGCPIVKAFRQLAPACGNSYVRSSLNICVDEISQGETPATSLAHWKLLPTVPLSLLKTAGEEGNYEKACRQGAEITESDLVFRLESLASFLEPAALMIMAFVTGFVVLSTALPTAQLLQKI